MNGSEATSYTWDKASRLTSIVHAGQTTSNVYDVAGRLTSKTLPNGIVQTLSYDDASRLTAITYTQPGGAVIEAISYTYDANGRRLSKTSASNSTAQETPFTATYDDADRMTSVVLKGTGAGGADQNCTLAYDDNGNLASKTCGADVTSYSWDSRNRLRTITGPGVNAAFDYDVLGRRTTRTVNGVLTAYVYDGAQAIAQTKDGIRTSLLTGLQIDEVIATYAASGNRTMLTDALGSVIAETKDDRSTATLGEYTPFGQSTQSGEASAVDSQYTGRENDGTGLYFYRARYFDAQLKRFVSQDPIGLRGGINQYAYVGGDPINLIDPSGQCPWCVAAVASALIDVAIQLALNDFNFDCINWWQVAGSAAVGGAGFAAADKLLKLYKAAKAAKGATVEGRALANYHPPNNGVVGESSPFTLLPGAKVDRFGRDAGRYLSPQGTPTPMRALPPTDTPRAYSIFEVQRPFTVQAGTAAPAYGQPGLGTQFFTDRSISDLLRGGYLTRVGP